MCVDFPLWGGDAEAGRRCPRIAPESALLRVTQPSPRGELVSHRRVHGHMKAEEEEVVDMSARSPSGVGRASRLDQRSLLEEEEEEEVEEDEEE